MNRPTMRTRADIQLTHDFANISVPGKQQTTGEQEWLWQIPQ